MDNKDIDAVYNLMQNVSDKLSSISSQFETKSQNEDEPQIQQILDRQEAIGEYLVSLNKEKKKNLGQVNNHNEYVLFGKDSTMNSRLFFVLASLIIMIWLGFKYLAPVLTEQKILQTENRNYKMMQDYLYLKAMSDENSIVPINQLMKKIKSNDANFIKEFNYMLNQHKKIERRLELENELKKLK